MSDDIDKKNMADERPPQHTHSRSRRSSLSGTLRGKLNYASIARGISQRRPKFQELFFVLTQSSNIVVVDGVADLQKTSSQGTPSLWAYESETACETDEEPVFTIDLGNAAAEMSPWSFPGEVNGSEEVEHYETRQLSSRNLLRRTVKPPSPHIIRLFVNSDTKTVTEHIICARDGTMVELWYSAIRELASRNVQREHLVPEIEICSFAADGSTTFYTICTTFGSLQPKPDDDNDDGDSDSKEDEESARRSSTASKGLVKRFTAKKTLESSKRFSAFVSLRKTLVGEFKYLESLLPFAPSKLRKSEPSIRKCHLELFLRQLVFRVTLLAEKKEAPKSGPTSPRGLWDSLVLDESDEGANSDDSADFFCGGSDSLIAFLGIFPENIAHAESIAARCASDQCKDNENEEEDQGTVPERKDARNFDSIVDGDQGNEEIRSGDDDGALSKGDESIPARPQSIAPKAPVVSARLPAPPAPEVLPESEVEEAMKRGELQAEPELISPGQAPKSCCIIS